MTSLPWCAGSFHGQSVSRYRPGRDRYAWPAATDRPRSSLHRSRCWAWSAGAAIIALSATFPGFVTPAAIIVGIFYVLKGGQDKRRRLYVGAVVSIYIGVWTLGWTGGAFPELNLWLNGTAIVVLLAMAWILRLPSAIPAALFIMVAGAEAFMPTGRLQWGSFVMVMGFTSLLAGIAMNLCQKRENAP